MQPRKTNFDRLALESLERVGLMTSPALLNTLSLAAELAGAVNSFRASGLRPLKRMSLKICSPRPAMPLSEVNRVNCWLMSLIVRFTGAPVDGNVGKRLCDDINEKSLDLLETGGAV